MKIPKTVHFCGIDYEIVEIDDLDAGENWGRTMIGQGKIFLDKKSIQAKKEETFLHELIHLAYHATTNELDNKMEERIVKAWSFNLYGILVDNNLLCQHEEVNKQKKAGTLIIREGFE